MNQTASLDISADVLYDAIDHVVEEARGHLRAGQIASLEGLDRQVAVLCHVIQEMPREEAQKMLPQLDGLLANIQALQDEMQAARDQVKQEIDGTKNIQRAHKAYKQSDAMDGHMIGTPAALPEDE